MIAGDDHCSGWRDMSAAFDDCLDDLEEHDHARKGAQPVC